jgi:hypothetical protein
MLLSGWLGWGVRALRVALNRQCTHHDQVHVQLPHCLLLKVHTHTILSVVACAVCVALDQRLLGRVGWVVRSCEELMAATVDIRFGFAPGASVLCKLAAVRGSCSHSSVCPRRMPDSFTHSQSVSHVTLKFEKGGRTMTRPHNHSRTMAMWMLMLGAAAVATVSAQNEGPGRGLSALFCLHALSSPQHWHVYSSSVSVDQHVGTRCACRRVATETHLSTHLISLPAGPWEVVTPESMGLSTAALQKAETDTSKAAGSRYCYLVVKKVRAWVLVT